MNFTKNPIGVQLYTLRDQCVEGFYGVLEELAEIGYGAVEFAGLYGKPPEEIRQVLKSSGLVAPSCHVALDEIQRDFSEIIRTYRDNLGCKYIIVPSGPQDYSTPNLWLEFIKSMNDIAEDLAKEDLTLCYHNHAFEFSHFQDDQTAFDAMFFDKHPPHFLMELDVFWAEKAGQDYREILKKSRGRCPLLHIKDLSHDNQADLPIGDGKIHWQEVFQHGNDSGVEWLIVEQDHPSSPALGSVKKSLDYLKSIGLEK